LSALHSNQADDMNSRASYIDLDAWLDLDSLDILDLGIGLSLIGGEAMT